MGGEAIGVEIHPSVSLPDKVGRHPQGHDGWVHTSSANRCEFKPSTPTYLGRGSEGLVLWLSQIVIHFEQLKGCLTRLF